MTDQGNTPHDTKVNTLVIDDALKDEALTQIKNLARGNKCKDSDVVLEKFEGEVLQFQAENLISIHTKKSERLVPGRYDKAINVANAVALAEEMNRAYLSLFQDKATARKIRELLLNRKDKGFAADGVALKIPFWKKEFVVYEPCKTCRTTGSVSCGRCHAKGVDICSKCHGSGMSHCTHCNGAQMIAGPNNERTQCPVCHGTGRTSCTLCNQSGKVTCVTCRGKGTTTCPGCQGHCWSSHIHTMTLEGRTAFDYPRKRLPEKVTDLIDKHDSHLYDFATIATSQEQFSAVNADDADKMKRMESAQANRDYIVPILYDVTLPYGHIEYTIKGNSYYTFLFGKNGDLEHVSPFLDVLIKPGLQHLDDAATGNGDVIENLQHAATFKTIKTGMALTAHYSLAKAQKALKEKYPIGLTDDVIKKIITQTDKALKAISNKPRQIGMAAAAGLNTLLMALYFLSPLRSTLTSKIANVQLYPLYDILLLLASLALGVFIIQGVAQSKIKHAMASILSKTKAVAPPKIGTMGLWHAGLTCLLFVVMLELSLYIGDAPVEWFKSIR